MADQVDGDASFAMHPLPLDTFASLAYYVEHDALEPRDANYCPAHLYQTRVPFTRLLHHLATRGRMPPFETSRMLANATARYGDSMVSVQVAVLVAQVADSIAPKHLLSYSL